MKDRPCSCGSGKPRFALNDARGIFCAYVCEDCEEARRKTYRRDIFDDPNYDAPDLGDDTSDFD